MLSFLKKYKLSKEDAKAKYYIQLNFKDLKTYFHIIFKPSRLMKTSNNIYQDIMDSDLKKIYDTTNGFSLFSGSLVVGGFTSNDIPSSFNTTDIINLTLMNQSQRNHPVNWITFGTISIDDDYGFLVFDTNTKKYYLVTNFQKYKVLKIWNNINSVIGELISFYEANYNNNGLSKTNSKLDSFILNLVNYKY